MVSDLIIEATFVEQPGVMPNEPQRRTECSSYAMTGGWRKLKWEHIRVASLDNIQIKLSARGGLIVNGHTGETFVPTLSPHTHTLNLSKMMKGKQRVLPPCISGFSFRVKATRVADEDGGGFILSSFWFSFFAETSRDEMMSRISRRQTEPPW